jgi:hypothetical protein
MMYTDENGTTHYEYNETFHRVVRYTTTHVPQIVTAVSTFGLLLVGVKMAKQLKSTDGMIEGALRNHYDYVQGVMEDIPRLKIEGRKHKFYPGIGVLLEDTVKELKEAAKEATDA